VASGHRPEVSANAAEDGMCVRSGNCHKPQAAGGACVRASQPTRYRALPPSQIDSRLRFLRWSSIRRFACDMV